LRSGVQLISRCVFLRLVHSMLPVFLDCPFLIAPSVFSNVYCIYIKAVSVYTECDTTTLFFAVIATNVFFTLKWKINRRQRWENCHTNKTTSYGYL